MILNSVSGISGMISSGFSPFFDIVISFRKLDTTHRDAPEFDHISAFILTCSAIENTESNMAILSRLLQAIANPPA